MSLYSQDSLQHFRSRNDLTSFLRHNWDRQNEQEDPNKALKILDLSLKNLWRQPQNRSEAEELLWIQLSRAEYLFQLGKVLEAVKAFEVALAWHRRYRFDEMVEYLYKPLIAHYTRLGENEKARVLYEFAFREANQESLPGLYNNLGLTYWNEGRNTEALTYFQKGLLVTTLSSAQRGLLQLSIARSQFELGKIETARKALQQSIQTLENIPEKDGDVADYLAGAYTLQGQMLREANQYSPAESALHKALQLAHSVYGSKHREYGKINVELGYLFLQKNQAEDAIAFFDAALQAVVPSFKARAPIDLPEVKSLYEENTLYEALAGKAEALAQLHQKNQQRSYLKAAFACHQLAQQVELSLRNTLQFESSKLNLLAYSRRRMEAGLAIAFQLYAHTKESKILQSAWTMLEQNKAAVLLEAVQENGLKQALNQGDTLLQKELQLKQRIAYLETAALNAENSAQAGNFKLQANLSRDELAGLKKQLALKYPAYAQLKNQLQDLDFTALHQKLLRASERSIILEYFVGEKQIYLFSLTKNGQVRGALLGSAALLREQVQQLRQLMQDKSGGELNTYQNQAQALFQKLLPAETLQLGSKQKVVLIPDAWLGTLPFEALVSGKKLAKRWSQVAFWTKNVQVQYGYSLGVLLAQASLARPRHSRLLAFAPEFPSGERGLAPLRNSKREVQQIKGIRKKAFFQQQASWQNFVDQAPGFSVLHLATHASADSLGDAAGIEFYERRAFLPDIYALNLQADLVSLSACESGLGELQQGEGLMSLARAFAFAGAKGLVATLWSVNEASSSALFQSFYQELRRGKSKAEALHLAKLDYLNNPEIPAFQKTPYYWAALTYVGEDGEVQMGKGSVQWYVILGLALAIGVLGVYFREFYAWK